MSEQVMIDLVLLEEIADSLDYEVRDVRDKVRALLASNSAKPVSAQPAGEVPEVVAYGSSQGLGPVLPIGRLGSSGAPMSCYDLPLMTIAQHTRIVAALQALAVVIPERRGLSYTDWRQWSEQDLGFNKALDEVARLNGGQFDPLEWSRKHGIEEY